MNQTLPTYLASVRERPLLGRIEFGRQDFRRLLGELRTTVQKMREQGGGLLLVPHSREQDPSVSVLLHMLSSAVRKDRPEESAHLIRPDQVSSNLEDDLATGTLIVPHLPRFSGLLDYLEGEGLNERVVVGSGLKSEFKRLSLSLPHRIAASLPPVPQWNESQIVDDLVRKVERLPDFHRRLYFLTAAWDACEIPLPLDILARSLEVSKAEAGGAVERLNNEELLFWVEGRSYRDSRVATGSPVLASEVFQRVGGSEDHPDITSSSPYQHVLRVLDDEDEAERYVGLQLFQHAVAPSSTRLLSSDQIAEFTNLATVKQMWESTSPAEAVLWGRTLSRLRLFDKAEAVLESAMRRHRRNAHLLHAHAQTLADQVQINASRASEATGAFEKAIDQAPDNCYLYQSWAVMRAKSGRDPVPVFKRALRAAGSPGERAAVHVAWADYETERGNYDAAEDQLDEAESDAPGNAYVPHVRGKVAFQKGKYDDAEAHFHEVIDRDLHSVVAWNALGYMARLRGHWDVAQEWLDEALDVDPENVPTLHERGNLLADLADAEERKTGGDVQAAKETRRDALTTFDKALALEPDNVQVLVSSASARLPFAVEEGGDERTMFRRKLEKALRLAPGNAHALHVYGLFHMELARHPDTSTRADEQRQNARDRFEEALSNDDGNLPALCSLAKLHVDAGDEEAARRSLDNLKRALGASSPPVHERIRALNAHAEIEHRLGNVEKAVGLAEEAREMDDENQYTLRLLKRLRDDRNSPE